MKRCKEPPPIDWLWAAVLERKTVLGYDLKTLAMVAGVSYETMRRYIRRSPWTWTQEARDAVCEELGITPMVSIQPSLANGLKMRTGGVKR